MAAKVHFPIRLLLEFYDQSAGDHSRHTTAVTSVLGEELGAGLLVDYYQRHGYKADVLDQPCTQGTKKGKRLDRWIKVVKGKQITFYQVEIKNWAASAIGGRFLALDASKTVLREHKKERWSKEWDGKIFIKEQVRKVLIPMKPPLGADHIEPLVCFWDAMHPTGKSEALFSIPINHGKFNRVWVFSMSAHLRNLRSDGLDFVEVDAHATQARIKLLNDLVNDI